MCVGVIETSDVLPNAATTASSDAVCMCKPDGARVNDNHKMMPDIHCWLHVAAYLAACGCIFGCVWLHVWLRVWQLVDC